MPNLYKPTQDALLAAQLDITAPQVVEVSWSDDRTIVWVNVDGICLVRVCRIPLLQVKGNAEE